MSLHVVQIGNVGPKSWATFTTENHLMQSLTALGHQVTPVMEGPRCDRDVMRALRAGPVDLVLYTRTDGIGWDHAAAIDCWEECARRGVPTAALHLDVFFGLHRRGVKVTRDNALFAVDHVFTADGDHDDEFAERGIVHHWLPPGVLYEECYVGQPRPEYAGDVAFVGSARGYHDEWPRRAELVDALEATYAGRFTRAGDGVTVREGALNDLYASVKVSAGDSLAPLGQASRYWSDRLPEATGRGSVLVHPRMDAAVDLFGDHIVWCDWTIADQLAAIDEVLTWSAARREAHVVETVEFVRREHSYRARMQTVLDTVFG